MLKSHVSRIAGPCYVLTLEAELGPISTTRFRSACTSVSRLPTWTGCSPGLWAVSFAALALAGVHAGKSDAPRRWRHFLRLLAVGVACKSS